MFYYNEPLKISSEQKTGLVLPCVAVVCFVPTGNTIVMGLIQVKA